MFFQVVFGFEKMKFFEFLLIVSDLTFSVDMASLLSNSMIRMNIATKKVNKGKL